MIQLESLLRTTRFNKVDGLIALVIFALMMKVSIDFCAPGVTGTFHDDGVYVSNAKALAEGHGYKLINFPGEPNQTKYPIVYPFLLSAIWFCNPTFPDNLFAMQLVSAISAALFLALSYLYLVRFKYASRVVAADAALICMTIPGFVFFGGQVLSEMPFALSLVVALWAFDSYCLRNQKSALSKVLLGVAMTLPPTIRLMGWVVPVALAFILWRRKLLDKIIVLSCAATGVVAILHIILGALNKAASQTDRIQAYQDNYVQWGMRLATSCEGVVVITNIQQILALTTKAMFSGLSQFVQPMPIYLLIFAALGLIPWCLFLSKGNREKPLSAVLSLYAVVMIVWPWPPFRFLVPIMPYLVSAFLTAIVTALSRFNLKESVVSGALTAVMLISNIYYLNQVTQFIDISKIPLMSVPKTALYWSSYEEVLDWVKSNTRDDEVVACTFDSLTYLYTGRKCIRPYELNLASACYGQNEPLIGSLDDLVANLRRYHVRYLIVTPQPGYVEESQVYKLAQNLDETYKELVEPVLISKDGRFIVMEISSGLYN